MNATHLNQHISQQFNADLETLRSDFLEMGGMVENQVVNAVKAIETVDVDLADEVCGLEQEIDQWEINLDHECTLILARRQPAASDLRLVMMVSKATRDLERIGDEANKIAKMALALSEEGEAPRGYVELRHIGANVAQMINLALDAFARFDVKAAIRVVREDKDVDREYKSAMRELITFMMEDPRSISRVMNVTWALRSLERIGDHARNIAEQVIYLVYGTDVRHLPIKEIEKQIEEREQSMRAPLPR
ncbi:phosphate signaling complex protein PhoU [Teredinibacter sp. KSP-S5-2]|uniref:phosphate signaling complex protein PhoU n=1 Tax=Teredinibacter sp. KSP-S5-2 TaxID=3034506 RepID=UPI002934D5C6|nr:phosphate signaling complex protein PhoU [Teredinibacter sp. KSP-S5-2]WNO11753.1 phosphate signaling complex protein PhoU [Teredinibacter sp. KSP-S5-2]